MREAVYGKVLAGVLATLGQAGVGRGNPTLSPTQAAQTGPRSDDDSDDEVWWGMGSTEIIAIGAGFVGLCICMSCCMVLRVRAGSRKRRASAAAHRAKAAALNDSLAVAETNAEHAAINPMLEVDDDPVDAPGADRAAASLGGVRSASEYFESVGDAGPSMIDINGGVAITEQLPLVSFPVFHPCFYRLGTGSAPAVTTPLPPSLLFQSAPT